MVKVYYCPQCQKAYRFHIKKRLYCASCKEAFEVIEVSRSKFFLIQFPLLVIGFLVICYAIFLFSQRPVRIAEPIGAFIFGFSLMLFALAFQIMDTKNMETQATEMGMRTLSDGSKEERISEATSNSIKSRSEAFKTGKVIREEKTTDTTLDLFIKPNKPDMKLKKPKKLTKKEPVKITKLKNIIKTEPERKKARKIRRAI